MQETLSEDQEDDSVGPDIWKRTASKKVTVYGSSKADKLHVLKHDCIYLTSIFEK